LFVDIPWDAAGGLRFAAPPQRMLGSYLVFRAEMALIIGFAARRLFCRLTVAPAVRWRRISW